jgi:hypothetical protein
LKVAGRFDDPYAEPGKRRSGHECGCAGAVSTPDQECGGEEQDGPDDRDQARRRDDPRGVVEPWRAQVVNDPEGARESGKSVGLVVTTNGQTANTAIAMTATTASSGTVRRRICVPSRILNCRDDTAYGEARHAFGGSPGRLPPALLPAIPHADSQP